MTVNSLGQLVQLHREAAKLSRLELAMISGVGKTVIFDIEHGKQSVRWDTLCKIFKALNISIEYDSPVLRAQKA